MLTRRTACIWYHSLVWVSEAVIPIDTKKDKNNQIYNSGNQCWEVTQSHIKLSLINKAILISDITSFAKFMMELL